MQEMRTFYVHEGNAAGERGVLAGETEWSNESFDWVAK
jgi:hypothetical protein